MQYKYDIEISAFDSDSDERGWYSMDLQSFGNTIEELYKNAVFFLIDQDGGEVGQRPASGFAVEHTLRSAVLEKSPNPIKLLDHTIGTEWGPVVYCALYHGREGYFVVHYDRLGNAEKEELTQDEAMKIEIKYWKRKK